MTILFENYKLKIVNSCRRQAGFTFIELVMVLTLFGILSGIVLFNFNSFSSSISLQNFAQDIALQVKQAQSNSISGKASFSFLPPNVPSYGVYFDITKNTEFIIFADYNNDKYFSVEDKEALSRVIISQGNFLKSICPDLIFGSSSCHSSVSVIFKRPFPEAYFVDKEGNLLDGNLLIKVSSRDGKEKTIFLNTLGQISIK